MANFIQTLRNYLPAPFSGKNQRKKTDQAIKDATSGKKRKKRKTTLRTN